MNIDLKSCCDHAGKAGLFLAGRIYSVNSWDSGTFKTRIAVAKAAPTKHATPTMENPPKANASPPIAAPPIAPS